MEKNGRARESRSEHKDRSAWQPRLAQEASWEARCHVQACLARGARLEHGHLSQLDFFALRLVRHFAQHTI